MIDAREVGVIAAEALATLAAGIVAAVAATIVVTAAAWALGQAGIGVGEYLAVMIALGLMLVVLAAIEHAAGRWVA